MPSTLQLNELKIYPNPTNGEITVAFFTSEKLKDKISLINIAGQELKVLEPQRIFETGNHILKFNLTGVSNGIYLLTISTDKGYRTQRILISR